MGLFTRISTTFTGEGRRKTEKRKKGDIGEKAAARWLSDRGFLILGRNFSCPAGELDIVARKCELVVFAEVKTRTSEKFGAAEDSVTPAKQLKILKTAEVFACKNHLDPQKLDFRYDVFSVYLDERGRVSRIDHLPNAFGSIG